MHVLTTRYDPLLLQASSQGPPVSADCSLRCCWQVGSAPFVRRRCDCLASSAPFTNIQTYLLTYLLSRPEMDMGWFHPWVGLGRVGRKFLVFGGLDWVVCRIECVAFAGMDGYPSQLSAFGHISAVRQN